MNRKRRRTQAKLRHPQAGGTSAGTAYLVPILAQRAMRLLEQGGARRAIEPLQRAIHEAPQNADLHALLSQVLLRLRDYEGAERSITRATALRPNDAELQACLGRILLQRGHTVRAVQSYSRATALDPGHWAARELGEARARLTESVHSWHLPMLADLARNDAFEAAINRAVRPDDVVLDIGTGTGLLAMMAARAGARHVYACEKLPDLAELAMEIIARNGLADRITVIARDSTDLAIGDEMPERASLLVTETFDSLLIGEGALTSIDHARTHLLTENARIIPACGRIIGQLVTLPRLKAIYPLQNLSGFDLSPLAELAVEKRFYPVLLSQETWTPLTQPFRLICFNFAQPPRLRRDGSLSMPYIASGEVQALMLWIKLVLDEQTMLSSGPKGGSHHWNPVAYLLDDGIVAEPGAEGTVAWSMDGLALHFSPAARSDPPEAVLR